LVLSAVRQRRRIRVSQRAVGQKAARLGGWLRLRLRGGESYGQKGGKNDSYLKCKPSKVILNAKRENTYNLEHFGLLLVALRIN